MPGPLSVLALRYGSDKWGEHSYTKHYEKHFVVFCDEPISLLEIGIKAARADPSTLIFKLPCRR